MSLPVDIEPYADQKRFVLVSVAEQRLYYLVQGEVQESYPVSTAVNGTGSEAGSEKTPLGLHRVEKKIGADAPFAAVFAGRVDQGRVADIEYRAQPTGEDYVTSRILWLHGLEPGQNQGEGVDSFSRYIYIHGTHEEGLIGQPASHGCVRMRNDDVIALFARILEHDQVLIVP